MGVLLKIRSIVWGKPAENAVERRLILKIDTFILTFGCLMYWANYLDRSNLNNAYTSGMKDDLKMYGKELNVINTIFYAGYFTGQIPNNMIIQKVSPRLYFPVVAIAWGLLCMSMAFCHHSWQIMVIRFFQAVLEASTFPGIHYILGAWYKKEELGKRTAIFTSSGIAGTMFSGFLQGGIYRSLNGKGGRAGWRWLFIIDFIITIPIALLGYFVFPDTPTTTKAEYLTAEEKEMAIRRLPPVEKQRGELGWGLLKRIFSTWHVYAFVSVWVFASNTEMFSSNAVLNVWLLDLHRYSVEQVDYIPTAVSGVGIFMTLALGWYSDISGKRWHVGVFLGFTAIISGAIMLNPPNDGAKFFALFLNGSQFASQTTVFAWANDHLGADDAKRSFVLAAMNTIAIAVYMFWSILFYNTKQAPMWFKGNIAMIVMGVCLLFSTLAVHWIELRSAAKEAGVLDSFEEAGDFTPETSESYMPHEKGLIA